MNRHIVLATLVTLSALPLAMPTADACISALCNGPPVGVCVKPGACSGTNDACVYAFSWVPQCVDAKCLPLSECFVCACMPLQVVGVPNAPSVCGAACVQLDGGPGYCMQVYREYWIAPGTGVVMRDSCHAEVYVDGQPLLG